MKRYILLLILLLFIVSLVASNCLMKTEEQTHLKMGTYVTIILKSWRWQDFDAAFKKAFYAIDRVDDIANIYNSNSEVSRLNKAAYIEPVAVSDDLFILIENAMALSRYSDGAFDITVAPLVKLWSKYKEEGRAPDRSEIKNLLSLVGYNNVAVDSTKKTVFFNREGMSIDLSAIAKGYAVDKVAESLKDLGFQSAIVNAGGDIYCVGKRTPLSGWRIGIKDPNNRKKVIKVLSLRDRAVATSGDYEQYFIYKDTRYTHLIDPHTGYPKESANSSVTVIAPTCMLADGISTAVSVGGEDIKEGLENMHLDIKIIVED